MILVAAIEQQREHRYQMRERGEAVASVSAEILRLVHRLNDFDAITEGGQS